MQKTFIIPVVDRNGAEIDNFANYTLTGTFLKPDNSTEVSVTPTLVANTWGTPKYPSKVVSVILTAANNTAAGRWRLNIYAAAPSGNAEPISRAYSFEVSEEWA